MTNNAARVMEFETESTLLDRTGLARNELFQLQLEQMRHDERYHPEISRLTVHHRLNHLALHFAKYAGRVATMVMEDNNSDIDRTLTDIFIIALSTANVLNLDLGKALSSRLAADLKVTDTQDGSLVGLLLPVTIASGRMAKACESIDHLEAVKFREEISDCVVRLSTLSAEAANVRGLDIALEIRNRLEKVRAAKLFHGYL